MVHQHWHLELDPVETEKEMIRCAVAIFLSFKTYHFSRHAERPSQQKCLAYAYHQYSIIREKCPLVAPALYSLRQAFSTVNLDYFIEDDVCSCESASSDDVSDFG